MIDAIFSSIVGVSLHQKNENLFPSWEGYLLEAYEVGTGLEQAIPIRNAPPAFGLPLRRLRQKSFRPAALS